MQIRISCDMIILEGPFHWRYKIGGIFSPLPSAGCVIVVFRCLVQIKLQSHLIFICSRDWDQVQHSIAGINVS